MNEYDWILFNASPDIRQQILSTPSLQPGRSIRDTGIQAIVLVDSQIDHTTGLLILREAPVLKIYGTEQVYEDLTIHHPILKTPAHYCDVQFEIIKLNEAFTIPGFDSIQLTPLPIKSEAPPFSAYRGKQVQGTNVAFFIKDLSTQKSVFYAPGLGYVDTTLHAIMNQSDVVLVDGTFWHEDELINANISHKKASAMGHLAQSNNGMIQKLNEMQDLDKKILFHINNTNPILNENSPERSLLTQNKIEVSYDGMEFTI